MFFRFRKKDGSRRKKIAEGLDFDRVPEFLLKHQKWTPFVTRIAVHCGDLPAPDGSGTLVTGCVAAGCRTMAVLDHRRDWEFLALRGSDETLLHYKARLRLGLFFAGCLEYLVPLLCRAEVRVDDVPWVPVEESFTCFWRKWGLRTRGKSKGKASEVAVTWGYRPLAVSEILVLASYFFTCQEVRYVRPPVARGVLDYILPHEFGVFDRLLSEVGGESADEALLPQLVEGRDADGHRAWEES